MPILLTAVHEQCSLDLPAYGGATMRNQKLEKRRAAALTEAALLLRFAMSLRETARSPRTEVARGRNIEPRISKIESTGACGGAPF